MFDHCHFENINSHSQNHCYDGEKKDKSLPGRISVHRWVGLDSSEHLLRQLFRDSAPGHVYWKNWSAQQYIDIFGPKWTSSRLSLFKKGDYCPQGLGLGLAPWGCPTSPSSRPWTWSPLPLRTSAPPSTTLVVVLMIFAWCHSFFEFNNSPLWWEI